MRESNNLYGLKLTLGGYFIILALKLGAYWMSGVMALLAALLVTLSITWGLQSGDPLAAILVATIIAFRAAGLCRENPSFLLGRSPIVVSVPGVLGVDVLRAEYIGPG